MVSCMELLGKRVMQCWILIFPSKEGLGMRAVNFLLKWVHIEVDRVALAPCS